MKHIHIICRIKYKNSDEDAKNVEWESEISTEAENNGSAKHFHPWCRAFKNVKKVSDETFIFRERESYSWFVSWKRRAAHSSTDLILLLLFLIISTRVQEHFKSSLVC